MDLRKHYRDLFQRLKPSSGTDPRRLEEWYVTPPTSTGQTLGERFDLDPCSAVAMFGAVGSGKTTELQFAAEILQSLPDVKAVTVDAPTIHRLAKLQPTVVAAIAAAGVLSLLTDKERKTIEPVTRLKSTIAGYWEDYRQYEPDYEDHNHWVEGILKPPKTDSKQTKLEELLQELVEELDYTPIVFIDGLDRVVDTRTFISTVVTDVPLILRAGVGVAIVAPVHARFSGFDHVRHAFSEIVVHSAVEHTSDEGRAFLQAVLEHRDPNLDGFVDQTVIETLIARSGGVVRDMLSIAQTAARYSYRQSQPNISSENVNTAADNFGRELLLGLNPQEGGRLRELYAQFNAKARRARNPEFTLTEQLDVKLLLQGCLTEVIVSGRPKYSIHSAIWPVLGEIR